MPPIERIDGMDRPMAVTRTIASQEKPVEKPYSQPLLSKQLPDQAGKVLERQGATHNLTIDNEVGG